MDLRAMNLYDAYEKNMLPKSDGYIISGFFMRDTPYSVIEVVSYDEVKNFYANNESITFQSDGKKIYILVEPSSYTLKGTEPYCRPTGYQIPMRFRELNIHTCKNQYKIMYSKEPLNILTSFTVLKPTGLNYSFIVFPGEDVETSLQILFEKTFNTEACVPLADAKKVSIDIAKMIVKTMAFKNKKHFDKETLNSAPLKGSEKKAKAPKKADKK